MAWYSSPYVLTIAVLVPSLLAMMSLFSRKNKFVVEGRTVLLTGSSQGMGRGVAKLLAQKGANVILVARDRKKLEDAKNYIASAARNPSTQRFTWISADLTDEQENGQVIAEATAWNGGKAPDVVWQVAGSAHPDLFLDTQIATMKAQMDVNYWAVAYLAHAVLGLWTRDIEAADGNVTSPSASTTTTQEPHARHFIMTSSVAVFTGLAGYAPYSPAKSAMRSLADNLRSEMNLYNGARYHTLPAKTTPSTPEIKIHLVLPGTILSPGLDNENLTKHPVTKILEEGDAVQTEDEVARAAIRGLERGDFMITTQWLGDVMRVAALGGSPRNGLLGIRETVLSWIVSFAWLFIGPDLDGKVYRYGKKNGVTHRLSQPPYSSSSFSSSS